MRMLCAKWVPRELTVDQKQQRIDAWGECLALLNRNKMEFYRRYVTMDETWLHYYTPESKRQSAEWKSLKLRPILTRKRNRTLKVVTKSWKIVVSPSNATMLNNKIEFCQNFVFFLLILRTY